MPNPNGHSAPTQAPSMSTPSRRPRPKRPHTCLRDRGVGLSLAGVRDERQHPPDLLLRPALDRQRILDHARYRRRDRRNHHRRRAQSLALPLGPWFDRGGHGWARKYRSAVMAAGYFIFSIFTGIGALTSSIWSIVVLQSVKNAFGGAGEAIEVTAMAESYPVERRGLAFGHAAHGLSVGHADRLVCHIAGSWRRSARRTGATSSC